MKYNITIAAVDATTAVLLCNNNSSRMNWCRISLHYLNVCYTIQKTQYQGKLSSFSCGMGIKTNILKSNLFLTNSVIYCGTVLISDEHVLEFFKNACPFSTCTVWKPLYSITVFINHAPNQPSRIPNGQPTIIIRSGFHRLPLGCEGKPE